MIYHSKSLVLVRKGCAFDKTLYQEVFFGNPVGGTVLKPMQMPVVMLAETVWSNLKFPWGDK